MSDIQWEDPPERQRPSRKRGTGRWYRLLAPLVEHPGRWANLGVHPRGVVTSINGGVLATSLGRFEARSRGWDRDTDTATLYVRYVGPRDDA